jgi:hypothetical protein
MEILAQYGYLGQGNVWLCSLYGLVMLTVTVYVALNLKKPEK